MFCDKYPSIFNYSELDTYLKDVLKKKQELNPQISQRSWAQRLGLAGNSPLSLIMNKKRAFPQNLLLAMSQDLKLRPKETQYLETLVQLHNSNSEESKAFFNDMLDDVRPQSKLSSKEVDFGLSLSDPLHGIIMGLTILKDFKPEPEWMLKKLRIKTNLKKIKDTFQRLLDLGFLKKSDKGTVKPITPSFTHVPYELRKEAVKKFHKQSTLMATEMIFAEDRLEESKIISFTMNLNTKSIPKADELIKEFSARFIEEVGTGIDHADDVYQLNLQFYPVTKK